MTTRYKRNISARISMFYTDCAWAWDRHSKGFWCGLVVGSLAPLVIRFVLGV